MLLFCYINIYNVVVKISIHIHVYVLPSDCNLQIIRISLFFLSGQVDVLITYYRNMGYYYLFRCFLESNTIVFIHMLSIAQYNVYCILKDVVIYVSCVSAADVLDDFGISFQHICVSYMYVRYVYAHFKWVYNVSQCSFCYTF